MLHQKGFSLLEMLCVLAILSVLAYAGSAQFLVASQDTQDQTLLNNAINELSDALLQARQLAVVSGSPSFVCGGLACDGNWSSGFILYQGDESSSDYILYRSIAFNDLLAVSWAGFPVNKQQIEFHSNGLSGYQNGTFEFCLGSWQATLVLNQSGRFYKTDIQEKDEGDCL